MKNHRYDHHTAVDRPHGYSHPISLLPYFCRKERKKISVYLQRLRIQECQIFHYQKGKRSIARSVSAGHGLDFIPREGILGTWMVTTQENGRIPFLENLKVF